MNDKKTHRESLLKKGIGNFISSIYKDIQYIFSIKPILTQKKTNLFDTSFYENKEIKQYGSISYSASTFQVPDSENKRMVSRKKPTFSTFKGLATTSPEIKQNVRSFSSPSINSKKLFAHSNLIKKEDYSSQDSGIDSDISTITHQRFMTVRTTPTLPSMNSIEQFHSRFKKTKEVLPLSPRISTKYLAGKSAILTQKTNLFDISFYENKEIKQYGSISYAASTFQVPDSENKRMVSRKKPTFSTFKGLATTSPEIKQNIRSFSSPSINSKKLFENSSLRKEDYSSQDSGIDSDVSMDISPSHQTFFIPPHTQVKTKNRSNILSDIKIERFTQDKMKV